MISFMSLASGSSGNSSLISDGKTNILIDCGVSGANIKAKLNTIGMTPEDISAILITHEHSDHTKGVGVMTRRYNIPIYLTEKTLLNMNVGKIDESVINIISPQKNFRCADFDIHPFSIPHDAADPVGYSFYTEDGKYTLATDIGYMPDSLFHEIMGSKQIILESNHDLEMLKIGSYPEFLKQRILSQNGHMSNELTASIAVKLADNGTEGIMLAHLSHDNNTPEIAHITTKNALCTEGYDCVNLCVAARDSVTRFAV